MSVSPAVQNSFCLSAQLPGPRSLGHIRWSHFCTRFLPRATLDCSLALGCGVPYFSEKPKGSFTEMFGSSQAAALGEGTAPTAPLANSGFCRRLALCCEQRAPHHPLDTVIRSMAATGRSGADPVRPPLPSPEGEAPRWHSEGTVWFPAPLT